MTTIPIKSKHSLKSQCVGIFSALMVACGVNSGNPKGTPPPKTTSSIYLRSLPGGSMSNFVLRVRGIEFIRGLSLSATQPVSNDGNQKKELLFPEIKALNLMDDSQKGRVTLFEDIELENITYNQVRLLLDVTHAGTSNLSSGQKKVVHVLPLDLFLAASGQSVPEGARQSDQIVFKDESGIIKPGVANNVAFFFDLDQLVTSAESLNDPMKDFYRKDKKLTEEDIKSSLFLKPIQLDKKNILPADAP